MEKHSAERCSAPSAPFPTRVIPSNLISKPKILKSHLEPAPDGIFKCLLMEIILEFALYFSNVIKGARMRSDFFKG